jgi:hypothetical protein
MSKPIPIVQFFRGNQPYLRLSLKQAQRFNQEVILIGDTSNQELTRHHFNYADYDQHFQSFIDVYEHLSSNSVNFEMYCFQRFFVLQQWMTEHDQNQVFMIDSDLLLYADLTDHLYKKYLQEYEAALCIPKLKNQEAEYAWTASPHLSFWTRSSIQSFTSFCLDIYSNQKELLHQKYSYHQAMNLPGGICDMTLLYLWAKDKDAIFNLLELKNGVAVDHNINSKDDLWESQYELRAGIKKIYFIQGLPFEEETQNQFLGLHFQGAAKPLMAIFTGKTSQAWMRNLFYTFPKFVRLLLKVRQKLLKLTVLPMASG